MEEYIKLLDPSNIFLLINSLTPVFSEFLK